MVGACLSNYWVKGLGRKLVLFSSVVPLLFISDVLRMEVAFGLVLMGEESWAKCFFHDWQVVFQFFFVVMAMFVIRWAMGRLWRS